MFKNDYSLLWFNYNPLSPVLTSAMPPGTYLLPPYLQILNVILIYTVESISYTLKFYPIYK
jgi:hypothetical protein